MDGFFALLASQGSLLVFLITLASRLGAPVPAVPFLIVAGGLTVGGQLSFGVVALAAVLGNIIGDGVWFLAGRRWGYQVLRLLCRISLSQDSCVRRSESIIGRWGGWSLIAAKFVPGVSVVAAPMAGALGMSNQRFMAYETSAALIWTLGFLWVGRIFHSAIQGVMNLLSEIGLAALGIGLLALAAYIAWRYLQRRLALRAAERIAHIDVDALRAAMASGAAPTLIDVRSDEARAIDPRAIPGALGIALSQLPKRLSAFSDNRELVVFCDCPDDASAIAGARVLMAAGLPRVRVLAGGLDAWVATSATPPAAGDPLLVVARSA
jgi:membrane protein DedA with SNARE-associated domain/rhodanese-related sulfurtransferase